MTCVCPRRDARDCVIARTPPGVRCHFPDDECTCVCHEHNDCEGDECQDTDCTDPSCPWREP